MPRATAPLLPLFQARRPWRPTLATIAEGRVAPTRPSAYPWIGYGVTRASASSVSASSGAPFVSLTMLAPMNEITQSTMM